MTRKAPEPVPTPPPVPDRLSMTILSFFERCPRSAYLHLIHEGGSGSHAMARGSLFHAFAERATWTLIQNRELNLYAKAEGEDPAHAKQNVASLTAAIVEECSGRHIGQAEKDDARVCAYHWAVGSDFDPSTVVGVEEKWVLEIGGRIVVGKIDLLHVHNGVLTISDYKTQRFVSKREDVERSFQLKLYAALVAFGRPVEKVPCCTPPTTETQRVKRDIERTTGVGCPVCEGRGYTERLGPRLDSNTNQIQTREVYPFELGDDGLMRKQSRSEPLTRTELADFLVDLEGYVEEFDAALKSGVWEAIPGPHCGICPAWSECPIAESVRSAAFDPDGTKQDDDGGVSTPEQAQRAAERWTFLAALHKAEAKKLRAYLKQNGPVVFGDFEVLLETQSSRVTDHDALAVASASGQPFELSAFRKERTSTVMKRRKRGAA